ncbi:unnamed protein product [Mytilus edulis]|uniref:DDE Tnp4 domain-containing protein n=1 Tax=Mytilus edulis TaxID=6550 RepID=A0A8S3THM1_MYTED|nr:unnamed protein product [Mytilus edulis]
MCNANDDMYFLILLQNFRQYLISRRRPPILYNFSIRSRILDNADGDEFIVNDVYSVVIQRPYEFWILTGESTTSFQNIVIDVSQNLNLHGKEITSVQNRILLTLIWLRQYPTYTLLSMSFGISIATVGLIIKKMWIILWEICAPNVRPEMPNVVGMIYGTSHEIRIPSKEPHQDFYSGNSKYHCIHSQVICDNDKKICYIHSGFLGHDNDANAYHRIGPIGPGDALDFPPQCYILAESIYPNGYPIVTFFKSVEII